MTESQKILNFKREANILIVMPQADSGGFRYSDLHIESNQILRLLDDPQLVNVVIDLSEINYFGSELIGVLIRVARKSCDGGGRAALCSASNNMQEVLQNMSLFKLWPHFATRQEALEALIN
jgi:anti-anti-sigma factor